MSSISSVPSLEQCSESIKPVFSRNKSVPEIVRHYRSRDVPDSLTKRKYPGKVREFNNVFDAIYNQSFYGKVCVVHGSNGFLPNMDPEDKKSNRLVIMTPDSHSRFENAQYPLAQRRRALFLNNVHLNHYQGVCTYDLIYGNVPNMNVKFYSDQLSKFSPKEIVSYYVEPFVANSLHKAVQENCGIVVFDGFYQKYRFPKDKNLRDEYVKALDSVFDKWLELYLPYIKSAVVIGKN